ncbi:MAG: LssY C-terminal domain-containing protein [Desulfobacteraceae bacterium]|nr:LssY C-terminal domain-containing protein [Desulfobacteraceae bacterium]
MTAANDGELINAFGKAGWRPVEPATFVSLARTAQALFTDKNFSSAPLAPSFWHGRPHDFGFVKIAQGNSMLEREQARLWQTELRTETGKTVYVGTARRSAGFK